VGQNTVGGERETPAGKLAAILAWTIFVVGLAVWIAAYDIRHASVDVVYSDTWGYMHMIRGFLSGAFDSSEIFRAHNQNRTALLVGLLLASTLLDHFNQKNIENLSLVFPFITLANLLYLTHVLLKGRTLTQGAIVLISSLVLFSLIQWENFLLSINCVFFATMAFSVTSIVTMSRCLLGHDKEMVKVILFAVAVVMSELALFSMGGGVVVWVANLVQIGLAIVLFRVRALAVLLAYAAVGIVSVGAYLRGLNAGGSLSGLLSHPLEALAFFVIGTGNSLVGFFSNQPVLWLYFTVGLVLNLIFLFVFAYFMQLPPDEKKRSLVLISLILLGLLEQALITYGRLPLGVPNATTARYSTLTMIAPLAALMFLTLYADVSRACLSLAMLAGLVILAFTVIGDRNELMMAAARHDYATALQKILLDNKIGPEEQRLLEWESLPDIQQGNEILKKNKLSFYHRL
jgi:hypothetical protein